MDVKIASVDREPTHIEINNAISDLSLLSKISPQWKGACDQAIDVIQRLAQKVNDLACDLCDAGEEAE